LNYKMASKSSVANQ